METAEVGSATTGSANGAGGGPGLVPQFLGFPGGFPRGPQTPGEAAQGGRAAAAAPGLPRQRQPRLRRLPGLGQPAGPLLLALLRSLCPGRARGRRGRRRLRLRHRGRAHLAAARRGRDRDQDRLRVAAGCVVGVAGGATRAALAVHQARRDNVADVAAKDSSQETLVNGAGLLLSLLLLPLLDGRPCLTWATLVLLLIGHLTFNLAAIGSLTLTSLNRPRLRLAIGWALRGGGAAGERGVACAGVGGARLEVPRPEQVNPREPLLPGFGSRLRLHLGAPLELLVSSEAELRKALECGSPDYIIVIRPSQSWVGVGLRRGAPPEAAVLGCAQALILEQLLGAPMEPGTPLGRSLEPLQRKIRKCPPGAVPWGVLAETSRLFRDLGPALLRGLEAAGWDVRRPLLAVDEWRLEWAEPRPGHAP
ncbi:RUS family member 1 isoform 2-T2 [Passerculus sandwichensis]